MAAGSALHDEVHEVLVVDVALRVLLALQQLLHLPATCAINNRVLRCHAHAHRTAHIL